MSPTSTIQYSPPPSVLDVLMIEYDGPTNGDGKNVQMRRLECVKEKKIKLTKRTVSIYNANLMDCVFRMGLTSLW